MKPPPDTDTRSEEIKKYTDARSEMTTLQLFVPCRVVWCDSCISGQISVVLLTCQILPVKKIIGTKLGIYSWREGGREGRRKGGREEREEGREEGGGTIQTKSCSTYCFR